MGFGVPGLGFRGLGFRVWGKGFWARIVVACKESSRPALSGMQIS